MRELQAERRRISPEVGPDAPSRLDPSQAVRLDRRLAAAEEHSLRRVLTHVRLRTGCSRRSAITSQDLRSRSSASGLDARALAVARQGGYPAAIEADVAEERFKRYFVREGEGCRVREELRDIVLFAAHGFLKDPPFSRIDLVSCGNVLIYCDRELQEQVCSTFNCALNPGGFLMLGTSGSANAPPGLVWGAGCQVRNWHPPSNEERRRASSAGRRDGPRRRALGCENFEREGRSRTARRAAAKPLQSLRGPQARNKIVQEVDAGWRSSRVF